MGTPRVGALGVADATGDLYVINSVGELTRLKRGTTDEEVLIVKAGAVNDLGETVDLEWKNINKLARAFMWGDATDPVFKAIDFEAAAPAAIPNPTPIGKGTHSVLRYPVIGSALTQRAIAWQRALDVNYALPDGADPPNEPSLTLSLYFALDAAPVAGTDVVWEAAFQRVVNPLNLVTTPETTWGAFKPSPAVDVVAAGVDVVVSTSIVFTNTEAASIAAGDPFRLAIKRNGFDGGSDNLDGDVNLIRWVLTENI